MMAIRRIVPLLLGILFLLTSLSIVTFSSNQQVIVNVAPTPYNSGFYPRGTLNITTTGSTATFTLYLFNPTFSPESVPVYVGSSVYTTVTLQPFSYQSVQLSLGLGMNTIVVNGQTLYVGVTHSSYQPITTYINGSPTVYMIKAQPGHTYNFQVSFSSSLNGTQYTFIYTDIGFYNPQSNDQQGATPYLTPSDTFLIQVPNGIPQGIYYAYIYTTFNNATNGELLSYSYGIVIINVSYGLPSSLPSPTVVSENGVTIEMQNISGSTYMLIQYPFTYQTTFTITTQSVTVKVSNMTVTNEVYPGYFSTPNLLYYGSTVPVAISPEGVMVKLPQFGTATIKISSPSGTITLTIPPKITLAKLNVEVLSSATGTPIPNAKVEVYNTTTKSLITTQLTNSSGLVSYSLPIGTMVSLNVSALGYFPNVTSVTVSGNTVIKVYLTPVKITITPVKFEENGTTVTPVTISTEEYKLTNVTLGTTVSLIFSVSINGNVMPSIKAEVNGTQISVTNLGNGEYEVTYTFSTTGVYEITFNASYNGVSSVITTFVSVVKPKIVTTTTPPTTTTTTPSTTTPPTTTTTVPSTTSKPSTTTPPTTTPSTIVPVTTSSPSFSMTDIIIVVVVIVIAAIAAIVILRR